MKPKVTPWYPFAVKPIYVGWYDTRFYGMRGTKRRHWDGRAWRFRPRGVVCSMFGWDAGDEWRGIMTGKK